MKFKYYLAFLLLSLCSIAVHAYDFEVDGIYYNVLDLNKKTVAVTFNPNNKVDDYYQSYSGDVVIPSTVNYKQREFTVTTIGTYAFYKNKLNSISLPSTIETIENTMPISIPLWAFAECDFTVATVGNNLCIAEVTALDMLSELRLSSDFKGKIEKNLTNKSKLKKIVSFAKTPPAMSTYSIFSNSQYVNLPVYVPEDALTDYQNHSQWGTFFELSAMKSISSITLDNNSIEIGIADSVKLTASVLPDDAYIKEVEWTSSDESIARVDTAGNVYTLGEGDVIITAATIDGSNLSAECKLHVNALVRSIGLNLKNVILGLSETAQLSATLHPEEARIKEAAWKSLNDDVASVDQQGKITANGVGDTKIIVSTTDGSELADTCVIKVINLSTIKSNGIYYKVSTEGAVVIANPDGTQYKGEVVIPSSIEVDVVGSINVTAIGANAFAYASELKKIALAKTVNSIDNTAFTGCSSLEFVGLENGSKLHANLDTLFADANISELYLGSDNVTFDTKSKLLSGLKSIVIGNAVSTLPDVAVCSNTLERFIVEDGTTAILEPENYYTKTYKQVYSQNVKDLGWKTSEGGYDMYFSFGYQVSILHLKPLADLMENKTIKYIYCGREVDCPETEKPAYKIVPTKGGSYYKNRGYMDQYSYTYTDYIANTDYKENELTSIKLNQDKATLEIGEQLQLSVINEPSTVPSTNVIKWTSSNEEVAKVDMFGNVTMVSNGEAIITAETLDGSKLSASCTILDKTTGVDDIIVDTESGYTVYNMSGICVLKTSNKSDLVCLPKGIYIVNNKKVAIQ